MELLQKVFYKSCEDSDQKMTWHGMVTYLTDGAYVQMQDTTELKKFYDVKSKTNVDYKEAYPQGLVHQ